jgi:tetrahydromethanopterin S-methyltransferase subunit G
MIIKDNAELLDLVEKVQAIDGVSDAVWSEVVQVIGRKRSVPSHIIDKSS